MAASALKAVAPLPFGANSTVDGLPFRISNFPLVISMDTDKLKSPPT
jgi:hypothetical protein